MGVEKKSKARPSTKLPCPPWCPQPLLSLAQSLFCAIQLYTFTEGPLCQELRTPSTSARDPASEEFSNHRAGGPPAVCCYPKQ